MADIKSLNRSGGNEVTGLNNNQVSEKDVPRVAQSGIKGNQTEFPVGQPPGARPPLDTSHLKPEQKILTDAAAAPHDSQFDAAKQLSTLGTTTATDRLLGLDLRPTITGALAPPPGNAEFLRHLSPQARRTIMRSLLGKQRERMRRLARFLRDRRDETESNDNNGTPDRESFLEVVAEHVELEQGEVLRAAGELDKTARMLDILDELLAMQDYTISQVGTFTHG